MARAAFTAFRKPPAETPWRTRCRHWGASWACRPSGTVLGGFSQGGIMALSLLRTRPDLMHAAMVMHGRLLPEVEALEGPPEALQGKALWVSHGQQDGVIPLASAQAIRDWSAARPLAMRYREYPGAHEIPLEELQAAMGWLGELAG
jgi:phospholipase/carboxylesterase